MILSELKNNLLDIFSSNFYLILTKAILLSFFLMWIIGFLTPIISFQENAIINYSLERVFSRVCHQEEAKCVTLYGQQMLVCARCAGIYFGAFLTILLMFFISLPKLRFKYFLIASIPMLSDVLFSSINVYQYSKPLSFGTGLIFGSIVCLFLLSEVENLFSNNSIKRNE